MANDENKKMMRCSFCGKPQDRVARLIAGPGVCICNECVEICRAVLEDEEVPAPRPVRNEPQGEELNVPGPRRSKLSWMSMSSGRMPPSARFRWRYIITISVFAAAMAMM